jgi:hypothetical protein
MEVESTQSVFSLETRETSGIPRDAAFRKPIRAVPRPAAAGSPHSKKLRVHQVSDTLTVKRNNKIGAFLQVTA